MDAQRLERLAEYLWRETLPKTIASAQTPWTYNIYFENPPEPIKEQFRELARKRALPPNPGSSKE